jgi:hypothetical protein
MDAKMAKRPGASAPKPQNARKTFHLDPLAEGLAEAFALARRTTQSDLVNALLIAEYHRSQGSEREVVRGFLRHLGIDVPRRAAAHESADDPGQGRGGDDPAPTVRITGVTNRIGEIARKSAAPIDDALESLGQD